MFRRKTCPQSLVLEALADGHLQEAELFEVSAHLENCPDCRNRLDDIRRLKNDLKLAAKMQPPVSSDPNLEDKIIEALHVERRRRKLVLVLAPVAAVVLLIFLVLQLARPSSYPVRQTAGTSQPALVLRTEGTCNGIEGNLIHPGEVLSTGEDGRLLVQFGEGEYLYIGNLSHLTWHEENGLLLFDLETGLALFRFEGPTHRSVLVRTPPAWVSTLGTVFSLELLPQQTLRVEMYQGEVEVTTSSGTVARLQAHRCASVTSHDVQWVECGRDLYSEMMSMLDGTPEPAKPTFQPTTEPAAVASHLPKRATAPVTSQPVAEESLDKKISAINALLAKRELDQAELMIGELLRLYPEEFRLQLLECDLLRLREKFEEALSVCRRAEKLARQESQKELSRYQQGRLLLQLGRAAEAENVFSTLLEEFPQGLLGQESLFGLLEAQLKQEKYAQARITALSYLEKYPRGAGAREVRELLERLPEEK